MENRLTIVFVTNNYTPYSGGVVSSICAFSEQLRALGHRVYIITLDFDGAPYEPGVIRVPCPIKFTYKNNPMAVPWRMHQELESIFVRLCPDIVHTHHPFLLGVAALDVCKKLHIPVVFTFHTHYDKYAHYIPLPRSLVQTQVDSCVARYCQQVDAIVAPSTSVLAWLHAQDVYVKKYLLASPLLPIFTQQLARFVYKQSDSFCKLLCVSRFTHEKNLFAVLDIIHILRSEPVQLTLAGFGYLEHELKHYAYQTLSLSPERVDFVMRPSKQELCALYQQADLFIFCSQTETQGLVLLEAMAAGTPVVALYGPGQEDVVVDGVNGFLAHTPQQIVAIIRALYADQVLCRTLQYGAWAMAHQYTSQILTHRLVACYRNFVS